MNDNYKNKMLLLTILTIIFTIMGSTLAFWNWNTSEAQKTLIGFTVSPNLSCTGDGGGNITSSEKMIVPTSCTNSEYAIQRTITLNTSSTISTNDLFLDLWLDVIDIGKGLSSSKNFKYALTKNPNDCTTNAITGSFYRIGNGGRIKLLKNKEYIGTNQDTYYLYIWLDAAEENPNTMNQSFELKLGGSCLDEIPSPAAPVLDKNGMIPVTVDNSGNVTTVSENDSNWYDYNNKKWANAVLVTESSRANYLNKPNTPVTKSDILAYYVWIPKYKYLIPASNIYKTCLDIGDNIDNFTPECYEISLDETKKEELISLIYQAAEEEYPLYSLSDITNDVNNALEFGVWNSSTLVDLNDIPTYQLLIEIEIITIEEFIESLVFHDERVSNQLAEPEIDIIFETSSNEKSVGNAVSSYLTHPAFTFNEDMTGFWVGKFETTGTAEQPTILNGANPLISQTISERFTSSLIFANGIFDDTNRTITFTDSSTYGLSSTTDSHMMKNSEWGAVAYLSHSKYGTCTDGVCQEVRYNNYNNNSIMQTGCGATTAKTTSYSQTCTLAYGSGISEYPQSTNGNITGVFDMAGGANEYVMGNYNNTKGNYWSYINLPPTKYYDVYTFGSISSCTTATCGGHALNETYGWYNDAAGFIDSNGPWFMRGGNFSHSTIAGVWGSFNSNGNGTPGDNNSWRSVLVTE